MAFADRIAFSLRARGFEMLIEHTEIWCFRGLVGANPGPDRKSWHLNFRTQSRRGRVRQSNLQYHL